MAWREIHYRRWERDDGAVVRYDTAAECSTAKPWKKGHRGWLAYGPGVDEFNYLKYKRRNSSLTLPVKFKTASSAMKAIDTRFPEIGDAPCHTTLSIPKS
jgi:hypothetical protein